MVHIQFVHTYEHIISPENLLLAWKEFVSGKRSRKDVQEFERNLMGNILSLHGDLAQRTYKHSPYEAFNISDPKSRNIHKATVRDRLLHHAIYRVLYPYFDKEFLRVWFKQNCDPYKDAVLPEAPADMVAELSRRYIEIYEKITGQKFDVDLATPIEERIDKNLKEFKV